MKLNLHINEQIASVSINDEMIRRAGLMVDELVRAKLEGGKLEFNGMSVDASELKAITVEF